MIFSLTYRNPLKVLDTSNQMFIISCVLKLPSYNSQEASACLQQIYSFVLNSKLLHYSKQTILSSKIALLYAKAIETYQLRK